MKFKKIIFDKEIIGGAEFERMPMTDGSVHLKRRKEITDATTGSAGGGDSATSISKSEKR